MNLTLERARELAIQHEKSPVSRKQSISVGLSSGTSQKNRGVFITNSCERAMWAGQILAKALPDGFLFRINRVALFLRSNNGLYENLNGLFLNFQYFPLDRPFEEQIPSLEKFNPTVLVGPPSLLRVIADSRVSIAPKKVISAAEVLEDDDRAAIEGHFNLKISEIYQCTEGFLGITCPQGTLHLNEDFIIFEKEWIDDQRFIPIITDLRRISQPMVRYRLDDILKVRSNSCSCGSVLLPLDKVEGRLSDAIVLSPSLGKNKAIFQDTIRNWVGQLSCQWRDYSVEQREDASLAISVHGPSEEERTLFYQQIAERFREEAEKMSCPCPPIERVEFKKQPPSVKQRRIKSFYDTRPHNA